MTLAFTDERSSQQVEFHEAFILACGRVLYKRVRWPRACTTVLRLFTARAYTPQDWELHKPSIMTKNRWADAKSEVMVR
jgi:hypothetical protein